MVTTTARVLTEAEVLEAEFHRKTSELERLRRRLYELRGGDQPTIEPVPTPPPSNDIGPSLGLTQDEVVPLAELERRYVLRVLRHFNGNRTHTARALGIGTNTLWRKLKAWGEPPAREQ